MKRAHLSMICGFIIACLAALAVSCGSEEQDYTSYDLFSINNDMRTKVTEGVAQLDPALKIAFEEKLENLENKCNTPEIAIHSSTQPYMDTDEYREFKKIHLTTCTG